MLPTRSLSPRGSLCWESLRHGRRCLECCGAGDSVADPVEGDALFSEHLGDEAVFFSQQGEEEVFVFDLAVSQTVGGVDRQDQSMPELRRSKRLAQLLLVEPFVSVVAAGPAGVVFVGSSVAALVLKNLAVNLETLRDDVNKLVKPGDKELRQTKMAQRDDTRRAIQFAIDEARKLGHKYVGTEHLLLGVL